LINELYNGFVDNALKATSGDYQKAEHLMDCSYFEYYYRLSRINVYATYMIEKSKNR